MTYIYITLTLLYQNVLAFNVLQTFTDKHLLWSRVPGRFCAEL